MLSNHWGAPQTLYKTPAQIFEEKYELPEKVRRLSLFFASHGLSTMALALLWLLTLIIVPGAHPNLADLVIAVAFALNLAIHTALVIRA
jgi:hypothetical protein